MPEVARWVPVSATAGVTPDVVTVAQRVSAAAAATAKRVMSLKAVSSRLMNH
ncbi:hypothetical protein SVIO_039680 [Streptomyces violaceusniger]|uniref:Uncharacterized protein n=1 Tax=Streptomyces violaceusniger TaxID=68280 RepID=A0A4D4KWK1_STRVO|nr:hypothetical protein SVIO_039680 [Streptomyces violaceusniger]